MSPLFGDTGLAGGREESLGRKAGKNAADPGGDFSDPVAVLRAFMTDMNAWEQRARAAVEIGRAHV